MISRLKGTLLTRDLDRVEIETPGGVVYEVELPLTTMERLPAEGRAVELRVVQIVREDSITLYGFAEAVERALFLRLLGASGVGAKVALSMMSTYSARRLARAIVERDLAALTRIPGIGRKSAEKIALELGDRLQDLAVGPEGGGAAPPGSEGAVAALVALGIPFPDADRRVRAVLEADPAAGNSVEELVRLALAGPRRPTG